jgi:starch synthase (maltosyl-transferring)
VKEHPEWFYRRPDGTIKYAENPPKKYEDIYPLNFDSPAADQLWAALRDVILYWVGHGVKIFRVDNPHTKPFAFWEWMIREIRRDHPEVVFLAEAFTRPKVMRGLAKRGFSQSYTYFTWRNEKRELMEYVTELATSDMKDYYRPNFFANTPDILHEVLQTGGPGAFRLRAALAATLSPTWGIYSGFELCEHEPVPGSEEYMNSEKFEIKPRDWHAPGNIRDYILRLNAARAENPALQTLSNITFMDVKNDRIIGYMKTTEDRSNVILGIVSLDPHNAQEAWLRVPIEKLGYASGARFEVNDLLSGQSFNWGENNWVRLGPDQPAHLLRLQRPPA